jgi:hypothetical protein
LVTGFFCAATYSAAIQLKLTGEIAMKLNNILTMPKTNKLEPLFKFNLLPANLTVLICTAIILTTAVVALQFKQQTNVPETKSLAWYMANPKEALVTNKICFDNQEIQNTENCKSSLHALEIMHKGPNS